MKPLKDIGLVLTIDATTNGDFESSLFAAGDHFDNGKLNTFFAYSLDERRELVRRVIEAERRDEISDIEEFLKKEGI